MELLSALTTFVTSPGGISLLVIMGTAVFFMIMERWFPYTEGIPLFRVGFFTDFFWYTIVQSYLLGLLIFGFIDWVDAHSGFHRITLIRDLPLWVQVVVFFLVHDFYIYWFHRWQHKNPYLWRTHEAHHSVRDVDWLAGSRSHAVEIMINQTIEFAPIVLLGSPEVAVIKGTMDSVWGMYIHSNLDVRTGLFQRVINGPEMHRWHHATDVTDVNFGTKLAVWDWMFGTAYLPAHKPAGFGLVGEVFPEGFLAYFKHHWLSIRPMGKPATDDATEDRPEPSPAIGGPPPRTATVSGDR